MAKLISTIQLSVKVKTVVLFIWIEVLNSFKVFHLLKCFWVCLECCSPKRPLFASSQGELVCVLMIHSSIYSTHYISFIQMVKLYSLLCLQILCSSMENLLSGGTTSCGNLDEAKSWIGMSICCSFLGMVVIVNLSNTVIKTYFSHSSDITV